MITSKDLAIETFSIYDVRIHDTVKAFYMRLGNELARVFAEAVGGRVGAVGENDVLTRLGGFEFCSGHNTKNHAGAMMDEIRGKRVQATGVARRGFISGEDFLVLHGIDPDTADDLRRIARERAAQGVTAQAQLPV